MPWVQYAFSSALCPVFATVHGNSRYLQQLHSQRRAGSKLHGMRPFDAVAALPASPVCHVQAYGACNYPMLGLVLQRALLICWLVCLPITLLWSCIESVLLGLGQPPEVAAGAAR